MKKSKAIVCAIMFAAILFAAITSLMLLESLIADLVAYVALGIIIENIIEKFYRWLRREDA